VAGSEFWRAAKAGEHSEETPFTGRQADGALSTGVIDLLFRQTGAWQIRDYKTDMALDVAAYETQLRAYREALRAAGCEIADAELVHVRPADAPI
jgi:ATP-dependent exoDNAse (exonuclease V) beta subunit